MMLFLQVPLIRMKTHLLTFPITLLRLENLLRLQLTKEMTKEMAQGLMVQNQIRENKMHRRTLKQQAPMQKALKRMRHNRMKVKVTTIQHQMTTMTKRLILVN